MSDNYYYILGIHKNATAAEIKQAFRKMAMKHHPDQNNGSKESEEKFKKINEAYQTLSNLGHRKLYDESQYTSSSYYNKKSSENSESSSDKKSSENSESSSDKKSSEEQAPSSIDNIFTAINNFFSKIFTYCNQLFYRNWKISVSIVGIITVLLISLVVIQVRSVSNQKIIKDKFMALKNQERAVKITLLFFDEDNTISNKNKKEILNLLQTISNKKPTQNFENIFKDLYNKVYSGDIVKGNTLTLLVIKDFISYDNYILNNIVYDKQFENIMIEIKLLAQLRLEYSKMLLSLYE